MVNPADGSTVASVTDLSAGEVGRAIATAHQAQPRWAEVSAGERSAILMRWRDGVLENREDLALLITAEQGKPLAEARGEVSYAASFIEWYAEEAKRAYGQIVPETKAGTRILVTREAVGVVAAITPWNFPAAMITRKIAPALAVGCAAVVKPAEETPLTALALAELARRAGFPDGVLNVVTGDPERIGAVLCGDERVRKLSFTGSTAVGKLLMQQCAPTLKKLSLELGGNAPFVVFEDADIEAAVVGAMASKFRNSGQTCVCANRFLVQTRIYDRFRDSLLAAVSELKVGNGMLPGISQGPLINEGALVKVETLLTEAIELGASVVHGGERHALGGLFFEPTVIEGVDVEMRISREEIFGPVATLISFDDEEQAISLANQTSSGLAAYCYTRDLGRALRVSRRLEFGIVGINEGLISTEVAPFGGVKESGLGREGGSQGLDEYLETKYTLIGGI